MSLWFQLESVQSRGAGGEIVVRGVVPFRLVAAQRCAKRLLRHGSFRSHSARGDVRFASTHLSVLSSQILDVLLSSRGTHSNVHLVSPAFLGPLGQEDSQFGKKSAHSTVTFSIHAPGLILDFLGGRTLTPVWTEWPYSVPISPTCGALEAGECNTEG